MSDMNMSTSFSDESRKYQCSVCQKVYSRSDTLKQHERAKHGEIGIRCEFCSEQFLTQQALERHWPVHHQVKSFKCPLCPKKYTRDDTLSLHIRNVHDGKKVSPVKCGQCEKVLGSTKSLNRHVRSVHENDRVHECGVCGYKLSRRDKMKEHEKIHDKHTLEHRSWYDPVTKQRIKQEDWRFTSN